MKIPPSSATYLQPLPENRLQTSHLVLSYTFPAMYSSTSLLQQAQLIADLSEGHSLPQAIQELKNEPALQAMIDFFGCAAPEEAILLAWAIARGIRVSDFMLQDLIEDFGKDLHQVEPLLHSLQALCQMNLLEADVDPTDNSFLLAKFKLPTQVLLAALHQNAGLLLPVKLARFQSYLQFAFQLIGLVKADKLNAANFHKSLLLAENHNTHLPAIQQLRQLIPDFQQRLILLVLLEHSIQQDHKWIDLTDVLKYCAPNMLEAYESLCRFRTGQWQLFREGFIQPYSPDIADEQHVKLTAYAFQVLLPEIPVPAAFQSSLLRVIQPDAITPEALFFEANQQDQLNLIGSVFQQDQLASLQAALKSNGLQPGISILLHGQPGTGKTASVLQWAQRSGRTVLQVEISQIRSKWLGDSEKNMRRVFSDYDRACREYTQLPVLLFNEADALFGRRLQAERSVDQVQNNLQNILLQAMEDFKGILVATTNLPKQLDPAFDRRFLYKLYFDKPTQAARLQIWKAAFPAVNHQTLLELDQQYALTGGQIRNIQRKFTIQQVVGNKQPDADCLHQWAAEELYRERSDRPAVIGFQAYRQCS